MKDIIAVEALQDCQIRLRFEDGVNGIVSFADLVPFEGGFAPLRDPSRFAQVRINEELGSVEWPCGADIDPDVLYACITGTPLPGQAASAKSM